MFSSAFSTPPAQSSSYSTRSFASPPQTPTRSTSNSSTILATSFALQNLISSDDALVSDSTHSRQSLSSGEAPPTPLLTPPTLCASIPSIAPKPIKLRLRSRKNMSVDESGTGISAPRIMKRRAPPKSRSRASEDVETHAAKSRALLDAPKDESQHEEAEAVNNLPSTPRQHTILAPPVLPLGLARSDFHGLSADTSSAYSHDPNAPHLDGREHGITREWTPSDDRLLVEMILEKMKLTRNDWADCARGLGRDKDSVEKRWKSLICAGEVGLKRNGGRFRRGVCQTWG